MTPEEASEGTEWFSHSSGHSKDSTNNIDLILLLFRYGFLKQATHALPTIQCSVNNKMLNKLESFLKIYVHF